MRRKVIICLMSLIGVLASSNSIAHAESHRMDCATGSALDIGIKSEFVVEDLPVVDIYVHLPSSLNLKYDKETNHYTVKDSIYITGNLNNHFVDILTDTHLVYENTENNDYVEGELFFGDNGYAIWYQEDIDDEKQEEIFVTIDADDINGKGTYNTDVVFNINVK